MDDLALLAKHGADLTDLQRLATAKDDDSLNKKLESFGLSKLGQRLRAREALLSTAKSALPPTNPAPAPWAAKKPPVATPAPAPAAEPADDFISKLKEVSMPGMKVVDAAPKKDADGNIAFEKGSACVLAGLAKKPELNGLSAEVLGPMEDGRYPIKISSTGAKIKVRPENLERPPKRDLSEYLNPYDFALHISMLNSDEIAVARQMEALKLLMQHCESRMPEHHTKLQEAGLHSALLKVRVKQA